VCLPTECGGLGFDAVWADDFHHVVRVSALDEHEGHYGNYRGSTDELIDTLEHGWHYRGQPQLTNGKPRGSECGTLSPENFIVCISNHDQVGNQPLGERFGPRLPPAVYRAASTLLLLVPYTPMLFMGQEWNASTPFRFFTDHNCELGRKVTEGRRREFRDFSAFADPAARALIPDPQAEKTFLDSKLDWREPEEIEHASTLALYREGLQLRKWHPALQDRSREAWQVRQLSNHVLAIVYGREMAARIAVVTSLDCNGSVLAAINGSVLETGGRSWRLIFSSNNERFGGDGDGSAGAATIVLEAA
jgi:maltooligosyltrehalose trehalohydrolase